MLKRIGYINSHTIGKLNPYQFKGVLSMYGNNGNEYWIFQKNNTLRHRLLSLYIKLYMAFKK